MATRSDIRELELKLSNAEKTYEKIHTWFIPKIIYDIVMLFVINSDFFENLFLDIITALADKDGRRGMRLYMQLEVMPPIMILLNVVCIVMAIYTIVKDVNTMREKNEEISSLEEQLRLALLEYDESDYGEYWKCSCGKMVHKSYRQCTCGNPRNVAIHASHASPAVAKRSIAPSGVDYWTCVCGRRIPGYSQFCECGIEKKSVKGLQPLFNAFGKLPKNREFADELGVTLAFESSAQMTAHLEVLLANRDYAPYREVLTDIMEEVPHHQLHSVLAALKTSVE